MVDPGEEAERLLEGGRGARGGDRGDLDHALPLRSHRRGRRGGARDGRSGVLPGDRAGRAGGHRSWVRRRGSGRSRATRPTHTVKGGEQLNLAGLDIEVVFTPGHSPDMSPMRSRRSDGRRDGDTAGESEGVERVLLSGDVLFQGSVGRTDLPGGDWNVLERSIGDLVRAFPARDEVYPGHMGTTTLGRERDTNPFLQELRVAVSSATRALSRSGGARASDAGS